jgi:CubicO group peptidase (beta-lactamase class C family)
MRVASFALFLGIAASCAHSESGGPTSPPPALARAAQDLVRAADARSQSGAFSGVVLLAYAGGAFSYSDGGYALLGAIVQRVSGEPFETYLQAHVFQPAGMQNTVFRLRPPPSQLARGYTARGGGPVSPNDPFLPTVGRGVDLSMGSVDAAQIPV